MNSRDPWDPIVLDPAGNVVWPLPRYADPFNWAVPSWITPLSVPGEDETRLLFDGAFISGADPGGIDMATSTRPQRTGLTAEIAPVLAPATGGISVQKELDDKQVLHVKICVDGKCYQQSMDLAPAFALVMDKLARWHKDQHAAADASAPTVAGEIPPALAYYNAVARLIEQHDDFWIRQRSTGSGQGSDWFRHRWLPFLNRWHSQVVSVLKNASNELMALRQEASQLGLPLPTLGVSGLEIAIQQGTRMEGTVVGACDSLVGDTCDAIVGQLVNQHIGCVCGSFIDDIGNAVKGVASGVAGGVASTLKSLKGPIAAAAGVAATGGAALIPGVGPFIAPIAGKLANDIVNGAIGDPAAQQSVAAAKQQAQTDPNIALALQEAQKAVATTTARHHVHRTAHRAAQGHPQAQQQIAKITQDAAAGDPAAKAVTDIISNALRSVIPGAAPAPAPAPVSGWYDVVGADPLAAVRDRGKALASTKPGGAAGAIHSALDGHWHTYGFRTLDEAIDWLQRSTHDKGSFTYAAAYEKAPDGGAYIQAEEIGRGGW
jgi:hypothetical protein